MQLEEVGQQAAATAWLAGKQVKEVGQKAPPPQDVSPAASEALACRDHPPVVAASRTRMEAEALVAVATAKRRKFLENIFDRKFFELEVRFY